MPAPGFGFWIADAVLPNHTVDEGTKRQLLPGPVAVEYPNAPLGTLLETADGRVVVQQPSKDGRQRSWVWNNIPAWLPGFNDLWTALERSRSRYRVEAGLSPYVYLLDSETREMSLGTGWAADAVTRTESWVRCRVIGVTRTVRPGGDVVYSELRLRFVVDDPAHSYFG